MNDAAQLDALRRIGDVKSMLASQELLRSEHQASGLPSERIENLLGVLRGCLVVIEASMKIGDPETFLLQPPTELVAKAA